MSSAQNVNQKGSKPSKNNESTRNQTYKPTKKILTDSIYYLGSSKQASDYEATTEFLINYIKKSFNYGMDIGMVLETLQEVDLNEYKPSMNVSLSADEAVRIAEEKQFEIEFRSEFDAFTKRKQALEMNMPKAYSFLWDQCARSLQNKIEARTDFYSVIKGNPIQLLKVIKQHFVLNYQES